MSITIITDCSDNNATARQVLQSEKLFNQNARVLGVKNDIEAAGNLIDLLDVSGERENVIIVNVAPRSSDSWWIKDSGQFQKSRENGTPFGYFYYKNTLVVSTIDGFTLSLIKKLHLTDTVYIFDIPEVLSFAVTRGFLEKELENYIRETQFRSLNFAPRSAFWLKEGRELPHNPSPVDDLPDMPNTIWWLDNFGNAKTTLLKESIEINDGKTQILNLPFFKSLKDVPSGTAAVVEGSSGINSKRFLEIVVQGGSAIENLKLCTGQEI